MLCTLLSGQVGQQLCYTQFVTTDLCTYFSTSTLSFFDFLKTLRNPRKIYRIENWRKNNLTKVKKNCLGVDLFVNSLRVDKNDNIEEESDEDKDDTAS